MKVYVLHNKTVLKIYDLSTDLSLILRVNFRHYSNSTIFGVSSDGKMIVLNTVDAAHNALKLIDISDSNMPMIQSIFYTRRFSTYDVKELLFSEDNTSVKVVFADGDFDIINVVNVVNIVNVTNNINNVNFINININRNEKGLVEHSENVFRIKLNDKVEEHNLGDGRQINHVVCL